MKIFSLTSSIVLLTNLLALGAGLAQESAQSCDYRDCVENCSHQFNCTTLYYCVQNCTDLLNWTNVEPRDPRLNNSAIMKNGQLTDYPTYASYCYWNGKTYLPGMSVCVQGKLLQCSASGIDWIDRGKLCWRPHP